MAKQDRRNDKRNEKKSDGIEYDERVVHINRNASVAKGVSGYFFVIVFHVLFAIAILSIAV